MESLTETQKQQVQQIVVERSQEMLSGFRPAIVQEVMQDHSMMQLKAEQTRVSAAMDNVAQTVDAGVVPVITNKIAEAQVRASTVPELQARS